MSHLVHRLLLLIVLSTCGSMMKPCHALGVEIPVGAYRHDVFTAAVGAPRNAFSIAQAVDGWIWFGTPTGLYRYDGVRFQVFEPAPGEQLLGRYINSVQPMSNGDIWIGYLYGGVSILRNGHVRHLPHIDGKPVSKVSNFSADGDDMWVASSSGLLRYREGQWKRFGQAEGFPGDIAQSVHRDAYGRVWAGDAAHIYLLDRAADRFERMATTADTPLFLAAPDGRVWAADSTTVRLLPPPAGGWKKPCGMPIRQSTQQFLFDRDGNYWAGNCPDGVCVLRPERQRSFPKGFPDLIRRGAHHNGRLRNPSVTVTSMMEDREGNLWIATTAGIERLRDTRLVPLLLPTASGWPSMAADATGTVWVASTNLALDGRLWKVEQGAPVEQHGGQRSALVAQGRDGTVLVGGPLWIERRRGAQVLARYPMLPSARAKSPRDAVMLLAEDKDGIWLYQSGLGLLRLRAGLWTPEPAQAGLARAIYAFVDRAGRTWFGTRDSRIVMVDGERLTEYGSADGVTLGPVTFVHADGDRVISGDNGTAVWDGRRFRPLRADGIDLANVSGLVATDDGDRWLNTRHGLLHVKAADWRRSMADAHVPLRGVLLDELDGFPGTGYGVSPVPTLRLAPDGRLWVSGTDGVAVLDRKRLTIHRPGPTAATLGLSADGRHYANGWPATLPAGTERLRFDFTAPSFTMPERVRFDYRLVGFDRGWLGAGATRSASYTNLGPGEYRFEVQAFNEDGIPGPVAATPAFRIEPTVYQTRWFAALCGLALCLAIWLMYRWRLGRIERAWQLRMDERLAERERIARTLHDTFLQGVQGLIFRLDAVVSRLSPTSREREQMEVLLDVARRVTEDGRNQVMDLRSETGTADLAAVLAACVEELRTARSLQASVEQTGTPLPLAPEVRHEVATIAREAIANAFRHANARRLDVMLDWTGDGLALSVIDDGVGLDPHVLALGRPGHWGLQGMRERAERIGASLTIRNRKLGGVEVRLNVRATGQSRWWRRRAPHASPSFE